MLAGYSIAFDPAKLAAECKVDDTGASIDDIEEVAKTYGLRAEQRLFPDADPCKAGTSGNSIVLPAIMVVVNPSGKRDFVNVWRREHRLLRVMDPETGVAWVPCEQFRERLYVHEADIERIHYRGALGVAILGRR